MSRRFPALMIGVAVVIVAVVALLRLAPGQGSNATTETGATNAGPAPSTPWGEPDLQGIWTSDAETPLQRPAKYANREFLRMRNEPNWIACERPLSVEKLTRAAASGGEQDVGGAHARGDLHDAQTLGRRTSLIVDPPDGRIPALTPEAQKKRAAIRDFQLALVQATDLCKNKLPGCEGGKYGPPSPRRAEAPPYYLTVGAAGGLGAGGGVINRADGPEDRGLGERCMAAVLPDFGGNTGFFLQIVQSPESVSIFYDTGQGQGWQRIVPVTNNPASAFRCPPVVGRLTQALGG